MYFSGFARSPEGQYVHGFWWRTGVKGQHAGVLVVPTLCEMDGVWYDTYDSEHYWACGSVALYRLDVGDDEPELLWLCYTHAEPYLEDKGVACLPGPNEVETGF